VTGGLTRRRAISTFAQSTGLKSMERGDITMGKVKSWIMDMEEDAIDMTLEEWTKRHGESVIEIYLEARRKHAGLIEAKEIDDEI
jgi:hypothetical protein